MNENKNQVVVADGSNFMTSIERLVMSPEVDPVKLEKFMDLQERILDRNAEQAFNTDMVLCQSRIKIVNQNKKNNQTNSHYADLTEILKDIKPIYTECGFALSFYEGETNKDNHVRVMVDIMHREGHSKTRFKDFPIDCVGIKGTPNKTQIHGNQSAFMYGRRVLTCMVFNVPTGKDDDGNVAGGVDFITEKQVKTLSDLINYLYKSDEKKQQYLDSMGIETLSELPKKDFKRHHAGLLQLKERTSKK